MKKILLCVFIICAKLVSAQVCFSPVGNFPAGTNPSAIITADFNKDGKADLAVSNVGSDNVSILLGNGIGFFGTTSNFSIPVNSQPLFLCTADFNEDGILDIATANSNVNNVSVLIGLGTGAFASAVNYMTAGTPFAICTADFNGDGHMDLAETNGNLTSISILLGNGLGNFTPPNNFPVGSIPFGICTGDFNKDGKTDLAVTNAGTNNVSVLINASTGTVTATFTTSATISASSDPRSVISTDLNLDGNLDLAVANEVGGTVSIFMGIGNGTFGTGPQDNINPSATSSPRCVINGDFNGDGHPDLATADYGSGSNPYYATVIINGIGSGQNIMLPGVAQGPHGLCSADFNGDGTADIAIANETSNNVIVLLNNFPVVTFSGDTAVCSGKSATVVASGAQTYTWNPSVTTVSTSATSETVTASPTSNTIYTVTANNSSCGVTGTYTISLKINATPTISTTGTSSTNVCPGTSTTITATGASTYTWTTGDIASSIIVAPTTNTGYTVTGTSTLGCTGVAFTNISLYSNPVLTVNSPTICSGATAIISVNGASGYTITAQGVLTYTYYSTDSMGYSIPKHVAFTPNVTTTFSITGIAGYSGCSSKDSTVVTVIPTPSLSVNTPLPICPNNTVTLTVSGAADTYSWSTSSATASIVVSPSVTTTYTATGTNQGMCSKSVTSTVVVSSSTAPDICMVTTDSASGYNYNIVYWDKTLYANADSFIVYRYDVFSGNYLRLGATSKDSLSAYKDTSRHVGPGGNNGDPNLTSWKYKLAIRDTCENISAQSPYHATVFLQNQNNGNFNINPYGIETGQVDPVTGYYLFRDDLGTNNYQLLVPISGTSATDPGYNSFPNANYRVDILGFNCNPTLRLAGNNSTMAAKLRSHSNTNNNKTIGIHKVAIVSQVKIYPNPASNSVTIQAAVELGVVTIYNALGEAVMQVNSKNMQEQIDISKLAGGVYTIEAKNSFTKLIKE